MYNQIEKKEKEIILTNDQAIEEVQKHEPNCCRIQTDTHIVWMSANHIHLKCKRGYGTDTRRVNAYNVTAPTVDAMTIVDEESEAPQVISKLMTNAQLREQCVVRGLKTGGTKAQLLQRISYYQVTLSEGEEDTYDCGCINHGDDECVGCEICGHQSCLDCHQVNATSSNVSEWICYEGHGCKAGEEE